jgi:hypothetical protein
MKWLLAIILSIMAFAGCGQQCSSAGCGQGSSRDGRQSSRAQIRAVVSAVYSDPDAKGLEAAFCSQDYLDVFRKVQAIDDALAQEGLIGFFDYNHWTGAQDRSGYSFRLKSVSISGKDSATATVHVRNCGTVTKVHLTLVQEDGSWKIDDLCMDGQWEKARMKKFIKETV